MSTKSTHANMYTPVNNLILKLQCHPKMFFNIHIGSQTKLIMPNGHSNSLSQPSAQTSFPSPHAGTMSMKDLGLSTGHEARYS